VVETLCFSQGDIYFFQENPLLTRSLFLAAGWFAFSLFTTLMGGHRVRHGNLSTSVVWLVVVILIGDAWAYLTFALPLEILILSAIAFLFGLAWIIFLPNWNAFGQVTWAMTVFATILFIAYSFMITAFSPLNIISFVIALDFFLIEAVALLMALTHTYESLELFCRIRWKRYLNKGPSPIPNYAPMVSLHVPAYNEPPEVVEATLHSLARLDYPNYEVLVVDNNTPDEESWQKIRNRCLALGSKFRFIHLDKWPGYKSGALNFALAHTAPEAEIIGSIDADYIVDRSFLRELVPAFADPQIGFVQAPQDYRDYSNNAFTESTYHGYRYFFDISMPVRNEYNAIIFCGTLGLIRKSALQEIGGWDEWCITEDAEASLRILKHGYDSLYIQRSYGHGLMPLTFEGLKKQRFRWCFGGIQILKKHWGAFMPWARRSDPSNHLTGAQRYFYLVGGLQWFTDVINFIFGVFLTLGAVASIFYGWFSVRPLTGPLLFMPALFLFLHMWRFLWVLRNTLHLSSRVALRSMYNFFSLGWAVTLACIQGLVQKRGVFLRTPKAKGESRTWQALRVTQWETLIGSTFLLFGWAAFFVRPDFKTLWLALLLALQASLYLAAPYYSLLSIRTKAQPDARLEGPDRGQPVLEIKAATWAWAIAAMVVTIAVVGLLIPQPPEPPSYSRYQPVAVPPVRLFGLEQVPIEQRANTPTSEPTLISDDAPILLPTLQPTLAPTLPATTPVPTELSPTQPPPTEPAPTQPAQAPPTPTTSP
jgi:cellulose synthase/poly-beta-1,6-N-acetylglucosamine synthase-like glycosyltransferase